MTLGEAAYEALNNHEFPRWVAESYGASGLGVAGAALFVIFIPAVGLFNWSESFKVPAVWLSLTTPLLAAALPVPVVWRLIGIITTAVAALFLGIWVWFNRQ